MAQFIRANSDFGDAFSRTFAQSLHYAQQEAERKRQEEQNRAIAQMYLESMRAPADAAVAPYQQNATNKIMQANTADSNLSAVNAPITTAPDRLADTRSLRFLSMTPEERAQAGITPEQSAQMNTALQTEGPINMQQANAGVAQTLTPIAQQANNQAQSAEQMLAMAKEKYGTAMFDRLAPIVASGKVPAQAMISIIEKQVQTAEKQAVKQATANAVKILSDPKADPAQKQAVLGQLMVDNPQAARGLADAFGLKPQDAKYSIAPDGRVVDMRTGLPVQNTPTYSKPEKPEKPAAGTWLLQTNPDGSQSRINSVTGQVINVTPPKETIVPTPFGPMKNTDLLAKIEALRPKEIVTTDDFGNKVTKKDGNVELYNQLNEALKAWQNKQNPTTPTAGNFDPNNLTPEQFEEAKKLKELGLSREQIMQELQFRKSGAKSR